jgi:hypothetical protein
MDLDLTMQTDLPVLGTGLQVLSGFLLVSGEKVSPWRMLWRGWQMRPWVQLLSGTISNSLTAPRRRISNLDLCRIAYQIVQDPRPEEVSQSALFGKSLSQNRFLTSIF